MMTKDTRIARITTIIVFIALIRTVFEPIRLQLYSKDAVTFEQIKPFLLAAFITSIGLFAMTILNYYGKSKIITALGIILIASMFIIKGLYAI